MKTEIIKLLREREDYISGQELCGIFGVSRTAVWKVINQLKEEGYLIEAYTNKGYRLTGQKEILSKEEVESRMNTNLFGKNVIFYDQINSTNTAAKRFADSGETEGTLVVANMQISGKGRRGRIWESPKDTGIFMSLILYPKISPQNASMLTLVAGLAVSQAIEKTLDLKTQIKWPNDIVINGKKLCGILTEMGTEVDCIHYVIVGIGINANMNIFPKELEKTATSISIEKKQKICRAELIAAIMQEFETYYPIFQNSGDLRGMLEEYNNRLVNREKEVVVMNGASSIEATALGINADGELIIKMKNGQISTIAAGEVSVRGIYGYV